jgi:hypothetical protein
MALPPGHFQGHPYIFFARNEHNKAAMGHGLHLPPSIHLRADELIE